MESAPFLEKAGEETPPIGNSPLAARRTEVRMIPVESSNIAAVGYSNGELVVEFHSGTRYSHFNVPPEAHSAFLSAPSHGKHYNNFIKSTYPGRPTAQVYRTGTHPPEAKAYLDRALEQSFQQTKEREASLPTTIEGVLRQLDLPPDSVMRGSIEAMMNYLPVETILERFGGR